MPWPRRSTSGSASCSRAETLRRLSLLLMVVVGVLTTGCGSGERTFDTEDFVEEINARGAQLELGPVLTTRSDGVEIHVLDFSGDSSDSQLHSPETGSATMLVMDDSAAAQAEFARCDSSATLTCFRAANVVLRFKEMSAADRARIFGAVEGIATPGD
jgi:hypothetical protein